MLTDSEIKELVFSLLDCRKKLIWMTDQNPINDEQKKLIEHGKELLKQVNQSLEGFGVELPG